MWAVVVSALMQLPRRGFLLWAAGFAACLPPRAALASLARAVTLGELVRSSNLALLGTPLESQSRWEVVGRRKRIVTYTRLRVDELLGGAGGEPELLVRTLGGQVGGVGQAVHGEALLIIGEPAILFVTSDSVGTRSVTEMAQGHYPVRTAKDGSRRLFPSPMLAELDHAADSAVKQLIGRRLEHASTLVRKAWTDAR